MVKNVSETESHLISRPEKVRKISSTCSPWQQNEVSNSENHCECHKKYFRLNWLFYASFKILLHQILSWPFYLITGLFTATIGLWPFVSPVTQETQTQLLLCPGGVEWSEAAGGRGALWGRIPAALCPGEGGNCQDTQPWPRANQGALPGHPQAGAEWPEGRNEPGGIPAVIW